MRDQIMRKSVFVAMAATVAGVAACTGGSSSDSVTVAGDVAIAYVKRPVSALGNPTDAVVTGQGGDLYLRDKSSPSASETNLTGSYTNGQGDVNHPTVSFDGTKIVFAMRGPTDANWSIWEYDTVGKAMRRIACDAAFAGDDTEPAYLPDGRIVFVSNRQETTKRQMQAQGIAQGLQPTSYTYVDEYDREQTTVLHVMNSDGSNCRQISFDQSHDRNPTVLSTGEILYSRWDHVGERNQFTVFKVNPDGTNLFVVYGAHSPGNSYMQPREMPDGRLIATLMPLSGTREGGSLEIIDHKNYSDIDQPGSNAPANQLGQQAGQYSVSELLFPGAAAAQRDAMRDRGVSPLGRYRNPYPLWDGTNRVLVVFTPSQPQAGMDPMGNPTTVEGTPQYGIYMLDLNSKTLRPVVPPQNGFYYASPVPLQARPKPAVIGQFTPDATIPAGFGLFDVHTVYDTDDKQRMGDAVLAPSESIPRVSGQQPDIASLMTPGTTQYANRVARFFRITKAVPTPSGMNRNALGETEFEMQQIVGYGLVEPDGSIRAHVPADTAINITVLDGNGRQFIEHTHWIQAREGERRFCKGCHSSRLTTTNPIPGAAASMAETRASGDASYSTLAGSPAYTDYWTPAYNAQNGTSLPQQAPISITYSGLTASPVKGPASCGTTWSAKDCAIVINFPDHIQPILAAKCSSCHSGINAAAGLDLSAAMSGEFARTLGYQSLMVGNPLLDANGRPIITLNEDGELMIAREVPPVTPGSARGSRLIERMFEQPLRADASGTTRRAFCRAGGAPCFNAGVYQNHAAILNASEKRIITEWIDIGGTYFNDAYSGTALRSVATQLSESVFACRVQPILQASCASCHQAFGGNGTSGGPANPNFVSNRFVLTGNALADFGVTATMVTDIAAPDASLLLLRPSRSITDTPPHPGATPVLPSASAGYSSIRAWIAGTLTCQ